MKRRATLFLMTILPLCAVTFASAGEPVQRLQRATGLWKVTPATSPFSWEICVDHPRDRLIDDDLWSGFEQECKIESQSRQGDSYQFEAGCPDARLAGAFKGDLAKAYTLSADTTVQVNGKNEVQHTELAAVFQGACPAGLAPGAKKMRGGMVMKSLYIKR
ncbi:DUF3617 family protein [Janthinobacterium sp. PLB04]|uniref:DUF3617 family protein n=1 Tax=Janthinobacterium lividum TaxID=29581 RepID=A0AAJ4MP12_9BURK|nr:MULTISPECIES: DUF3617 family protein [Janthinobacterium]KAB0325348.1 DUF3617 family protein [Janthinobacterium lividum]QSX94438.1 DUF3617 family protein [Janthinobacterium lividum]UGQ34220.1 DUF3617 family protein [Janthinobacterium sp. PLB04]